jgi:hypothetical protein
MMKERGEKADIAREIERQPVGIVQPADVPFRRGPHTEELRFRNACNKVLHATIVDPDFEPNQHPFGDDGGPLTLVGDKGKWVVSLNLKKFALAALDVVDNTPQRMYPPLIVEGHVAPKIYAEGHVAPKRQDKEQQDADL